MRIGIDASILGARTRHSGIGRYLLRLLQQLPAADPDSRYLLFAPHGCARPAELPSSLEWITLPRLPFGRFSTPAAYFWFLPRLARAHRLDLFHAPTVHPRPSWPPVPRRLPCPLVTTVHDLIPLTFYNAGPHRLPLRQRAFYRWNLAAAAAAARVITVSETSRQEIIDFLRVNDERVIAVYNGVDEMDVLPPRQPRTFGTPYLLFVGSYEARKNLAVLVRAFGLAARGGLQHDLEVVAAPGSGPAAPVHDAVAALGLEQRVRFVHGLSDGELRDRYRGAEVCVFPSLAEGFGLPPLEAMACGTPVIASGLPVLREVLGDAAVFVEPTEEALAAAIMTVVADGALRQRLAAAGPRQAARYSWADCARETLAVYRSALTAAPASAAAVAAREPA